MMLTIDIECVIVNHFQIFSIGYKDRRIFYILLVHFRYHYVL